MVTGSGGAFILRAHISDAVAAVLSISGTPILDAQVGTAYAGFTVTGHDGATPYVYSKVSGPSWMSVNSSTGAVTGTPDAATTTSVVLRVTDALGRPANLSTFNVVAQAAGPPTPLVADQTISFGALTKANNGGAYPVNTGGVITSASITGGTLAGGAWLISADGKLSKSTDLIVAGTLICSFTNSNGSDSATITIAAVANRWTVSSDAEADALTWTNATMGGKGVLFRGPLYGGPSAGYNYARPGFTDTSALWIRNRSYTSLVTIGAADITDMPQWNLTLASGGVGYRSKMRSALNIKFEYIDFYAPFIVGAHTDLNVPACTLTGSGGAFGTTFSHCLLRANILDLGTASPPWRGIIGSDGTSIVFSGILRFEFCTIHGAQRLLNIPPADAASSVEIYANEMYDFSTDCIVFAGTSRVTYSWNYCHSPYAAAGDAGHGDFAQWTAGTVSSTVVDCSIFGNVFCSYRTDGLAGSFKNGFQGPFLDDLDAGQYFQNFRIYNNIILSDATQGIWLRPGKNSFVWRNTLARDPAAAVSSTIPHAGEDTSAGGTVPVTNIFTFNIASSMASQAGSGSTFANNVSTGAASFATYFAGPTWATYSSKADVIAKYTPTIAYAGSGAVGSYIDFDARTVDVTGAPWL